MLKSKTLIAAADYDQGRGSAAGWCNQPLHQFYSHCTHLASPTCSDPSTKNEEGFTMEQEEWARELEMMSSELNEGCKGFLINAAKNLKGLRYYPDGIEDLTHTIRELGYLAKMDQIIGEDLHCFLICGLNEREPEDEGERITKGRADVLIRFAQMIQKYTQRAWTPSVKTRFEKGLDGLEVLLSQGDLADKEKDAIKEASK